MATTPPDSTICLVACANRASSRSIGGMVKNPGRKSTSPHSVRKTIARQWLDVAKSNAASSLRLEFAGFTDCWPAPKRLTWTVSTMLLAYDETVLQTTPQFRLFSTLRRSLHPDYDGIRGPRR